MNLTEKYPRIKPEAIKPVRHHTDWGTRLMFHPDLFPKYKGTRYDGLDEQGSFGKTTASRLRSRNDTRLSRRGPRPR